MMECYHVDDRVIARAPGYRPVQTKWIPVLIIPFIHLHCLRLVSCRCLQVAIDVQYNNLSLSLLPLALVIQVQYHAIRYAAYNLRQNLRIVSLIFHTEETE